MTLQENISLKPYTTFSIGGPARRFAVVRTDDELREALRQAADHGLKVFLLGGGSNILVSDSGYDGLVIKIETKGIRTVAEDRDHVHVRAAAGEVWDDFVAGCAEAGYWGVENMSAIPGTVGAVPIQNVGAFGQEAAGVVDSVDVLDRVTLQSASISGRDCGFSYRTSIFNTTQRDRWVVVGVVFRLAKRGRPVLNRRNVRDWLIRHDPSLWRKALRHLLRLPGIWRLPWKPGLDFSPVEMRRCISALRADGRLPDYNIHGNAGSFFKNSILSLPQYQEALAHIAQNLGPAAAKQICATAIPLEGGQGMKVASSVLILPCGAKDFRCGGAVLYSRNVGVVMNESGQATAADVLGLAEQIRSRVQKLTGIQIPIEPEMVGFGA